MSATLRFTLGLLKVLRILNWVCGALFLALLVASVALMPLILDDLRERAASRDAETLLSAMRAAMLIGTGAVIAAHPLLARLIAMVRSVAAGESFAAANADRLRVIAWALLALQLLDLGFGYLSYRFDAATGGALGWSVNVTGWIAVLLLFVLARVFEEGAAMRDELDATV